MAVVVAVLAVSAGALAGTDTNRHVVIISIDAFPREFYQSAPHSNACPALVALAERGSFARRVTSIYPSMTYPSHASIATGVTPARHGVAANTIFNPVGDEAGRGYWFASDLKAPALWDVAGKGGYTAGAVSWPCSAGSPSIQWILPEIWNSQRGYDADMIRKYSSAGLPEMIEQAISPLTLASVKDETQSDAIMAAAAREIIGRKKPGLLLVHLLDADRHQHRFGSTSKELPAVMGRIDALVRGIVRAVEDAGLTDRTTFIVMGDHGCADVKQSMAPNVLLKQDGFIGEPGEKAGNWKAFAQATGGSAAVHVNPKATGEVAAAVYSLFKKNANDAEGRKLYSIIDKDALAKIGGPPDAALYLEAEPGYMFTTSSQGKGLVRRAAIKASHGYLPTRPEMATGFIISGRGIRKGVVLDEISIMDIAPTAAALLGLEMGGAQGRVIKEIMMPDESK